jgi:spermidine/putrescine transport system permease protein
MLSLRTRRRLWPYFLLLPGLAWLIAFFLVPILTQTYVSLETGNLEEGFQFGWAWNTYSDALSNYSDQFLRSFGYAAVATVLALIISFPLPTTSRSSRAARTCCCS